ncbi:3-isopropylmalate dehydratase small subunit [Halorussus litoreus]|uniref:3-isopropylmalate dehydratase small subunit n=1 Tax=Halorussus litoreus TaxID=1710536 RepID=UPI000E288BA9|nr:3-isopropylmalate dehydratase small subunit [Halorussus litoreus]
MTGDETAIETVERVSGTGIPVRGNDIDTDQIIPARFLKVVTFDGLGQFAFHDVRFTDDDEPKDHPFNEDRFRNASVLVVNSNFGCGSSREHAPQALKRWGIDAVVGESFAEIFAGNCLALGVPTVTASAREIEALQDFVDENPDGEIEVDVADESVRYGAPNSEHHEIDATVDEAQRKALVEGVWDTTALMKSNAGAVTETARSLPYVEEAE